MNQLISLALSAFITNIGNSFSINDNENDDLIDFNQIYYFNILLLITLISFIVMKMMDFIKKKKN